MTNLLAHNMTIHGAEALPLSAGFHWFETSSVVQNPPGQQRSPGVESRKHWQAVMIHNKQQFQNIKYIQVLHMNLSLFRNNETSINEDINKEKHTLEREREIYIYIQYTCTASNMFSYKLLVIYLAFICLVKSSYVTSDLIWCNLSVLCSRSQICGTSWPWSEAVCDFHRSKFCAQSPCWRCSVIGWKSPQDLLSWQLQLWFWGFWMFLAIFGFKVTWCLIREPTNKPCESTCKTFWTQLG